MNDVLTRVEQFMREVLKKVDYEPLPADGVPRWSKSAQWERYSMAKEGLLKSDSCRGIWEITEAGRKALAKGTRCFESEQNNALDGDCKWMKR